MISSFAVAAGPVSANGFYENPLKPVIPGGGIVETCADPTVEYGQEGEGQWFMYCTMDPLNDEDRTNGNLNFHMIPQFSSTDLVHWTYRGDAFSTRPSYATPTAGLWAPEIVYYPETGMYHLYYTVTETTIGGSAIGVATSPSALGPWTHRSTPVIEPHAADCCPDSRRHVFDPEVVRTNGPDYIYYGSYFGGVSVRRLAENGFTSDPSTQKNVGVANKFEGPEVMFRDGWWYLFVSATDCCRGPLTGYVVMVGRSQSPTGPFLDKDGVDLNDDERMDDSTDGRAGGTPVIYQNGNRWVGPGHNTVFRDFAGQWWTIYHAIDVNDPYIAGSGINKRAPMLDPVDWFNGWPTLNGGRGPSDHPMPAPAAQPGQRSYHRPSLAATDVPTTPIPSLSDEFNNGQINSNKWTWIRRPAANTYAEGGGTFSMNTQAADLHENQNSASILTGFTPVFGNYVVETKVRVNGPPEGCCFNYVQAGLVIYENDDNYVKLVTVSIWNTRQTEFAKEVGPNVPEGYPRYGNTVVGPPGDWSAPPGWTWLRIVKRTGMADGATGFYGGPEQYTAYTSRDGVNWTRGGTWTHDLGNRARIGLVAMGGSGFRADFDYVRVSRVNQRSYWQ